MLNIFERAFSIFAILFFSDSISSLLLEQEVTWPRIFLKVIPYVIQIITIFLIFLYRDKIFPILLREKLLWIFLLIALASVFWSDHPGETVRLFIAVTQMTCFGAYFVGRYKMKEQLTLLAYSFGIAALLSILFGLVFPGYGVMGMGVFVNPENAAHLGAWRGIFTHKNGLGKMMDMAALTFLSLASTNRQDSITKWVGFSFCVCLILLSTSKTSLVILMTLIALFPLYKAIRWSYTLVLPFFVGTILTTGSIAILLLSNLDTVAGALGRDLTLTGRTEIWEIVLEKIGERPWLGYGYSGFWHGMDGQSADVWAVVKWACPHSHNGFLDISLDLGLIGLAAFLLTFLAACSRSIMLIRKTKTDVGIFPLMYLTFMLLVNLTESSIVRLSSIWVVFVIVVLSSHDMNPDLNSSYHSSYEKNRSKHNREKLLHAVR
jgi:exopolysaccharide production protein ExoQ